MSNLKNVKFILLELFIIIMIMGVGYAKYSNEIVDESVVNPKGQFIIEFQDAKITDIKGANKDLTYARISQNRNSINLNVCDLEYPGSYVEFSVNIVNYGLIPAKLENIKITGIKENSPIKIKGLENINNKIIDVNESMNISFIVEWDKDCNVIEEEITNFSLNLNYTQAM